MNNSTIGNFEQVKLQKSPIFVSCYITFELLAMVLHGLLLYIVYRLHSIDNQYYLIRILSIADSMTLVTTILVTIEIPSKTVMIILLLATYALYFWSLMITIFLIVDRWLAVKYSLRYHALVTKRKINISILLSLFGGFIIFSCLFFIEGVESISNDHMYFTNRSTLAFLVILRISTCVVIIVFGKSTIRLRNESEANRPPGANLHGVEAERLDIIIKLKRSIKDVFKLNIWTCVFLLPLTFTTLTHLLFKEAPIQLFRLKFLLNLLYLVSNPIIYLTCFTRVRQFWYRRLFRRNDVNPE